MVIFLSTCYCQPKILNAYVVTLECPLGRYGVKCLSLCFPHCLSACHHVDGSCRAGCEEGWTGEKCDIVMTHGSHQSRPPPASKCKTEDAFDAFNDVAMHEDIILI